MHTSYTMQHQRRNSHSYSFADELLCDYEAAKIRHRAQDPHLPLRLKEWAFPEPIPDNSRPDCHVCSNRAAGRRCQTSYRCKLCKTPLCLYPCFEKYHTLLNYRRSGNFRVQKLSYDKFSCKNIFVGTTPYRISVNNFRKINFRSRHRLRKYFYNENFQIYGISSYHFVHYSFTIHTNAALLSSTLTHTPIITINHLV